MLPHHAIRRCLRRFSHLLKPSLFSLSPHPHNPKSISNPLHSPIASNPNLFFRNLSYGSVNLVISQGKPKFETQEIDPPKKRKWVTKKRLKLQRKREKRTRKAANKRDPRRLNVLKKKKKQRFASPEEMINFKLERARMKEALLVERLERYEVAKVQGPIVEPHELTGEERFYFKKMAQKRSNYVPVGRRGIFGGVILNMHMHWKKHETVKVICKPCKPGQVHEYAQEIARLSGGIPIQIIGDDTIIFYRGKNHVQPEVMSPTDTLSKKRALEKSKYEQSLESVRHFICVTEKELELYYRHIALYGSQNYKNANANATANAYNSIEDTENAGGLQATEIEPHSLASYSSGFSEKEPNSSDQDLSETDTDEFCSSEVYSDDDDCIFYHKIDSDCRNSWESSSSMRRVHQ